MTVTMVTISDSQLRYTNMNSERMSTRRTLLVTALVALLVTASGCSAIQDLRGTETGEGADNAGQGAAIAQQAQAASSDVETYSYDLSLDMAAQDTAETATLSASSDVNRTAQRIISDIAFSNTATVTDLTITQYIVGQTQYIRTTGSLETDWRTQNISEQDVWTDREPLATQQRLLGEGDVSLDGNSTIDGTEVYELSANVSEDELTTLLEQRGQLVGTNAAFDDISCTLYVTHGDYQIKRVEADMTVISQGRSYDADLQLTLSDYNETGAINLPPEAADAE